MQLHFVTKFLSSFSPPASPQFPIEKEMKSQAYQDHSPWTFHVTIHADHGHQDNSNGLVCHILEKNTNGDFQDTSLSTIMT